MRIKIYFFLIVITWVHNAYSQGEANNWYFAYGASVSFNGGQIKVLAKSPLSAVEGCATISTGKGQFLLYTDGQNLYDSTLKITPNGSKLMGDGSCVQSSIFIPKPDSVGKYFLITNFGNLYSLGGIYYSEIDMRLNGGKGDIIYSKKNILITDSSIEMFTAVRHVNGKDYWLIMHKADNDTLCSFLITSKGISKIPVKSKTGNFINYYNSRGQMKVSPDGKKIAWTHMNKFSVIGDFDPSSGRISNCWRNSVASYGLEFSQNGNYLYYLNFNELLQFNAKAISQYLFDLSKRTIATFYNIIGSMQLGPDGKIYFPNKDSLSIIHTPDSLGNDCRFEKNALYLKGARTDYSMPSFVGCFLLKSEVSFTRNCLGDSTFFNYKLRADFDSMHWNFGDSKSGTYNLSKSYKNVFHKYTGTGNYKGYMVVFYKFGIDTFRFNLKIADAKPYLGNDTFYCNNFTKDLFPVRNYLSYEWNTGLRTRFLPVEKAGTYVLKALDSALCKVSDTIVIKNSIVKAKFDISDSTQCFRNNNFILTDQSLYLNDKRKQINWVLSDGGSAADTIINISFKKSGSYVAKLMVENNQGCTDSILKTLEVYPQTTSGFMVNETVQCLNNNHFDFINLNADSLNTRYTWFLGDSKALNQKNVVGKSFDLDTTLSIILVTETLQSCTDTFRQTIKILPSPKADFTWGKACNRTAVQFQSIGSLPINQYTWKFKDSVFSKIANPNFLITKVGYSKIYLEVKSANGCKDSITKFLNVKEEALANFIVKDYCDGDSAFFMNTSPNGKSFLWKFGDGFRSTQISPKHIFQIAGTSQTFNVNLVAFLPDGCADSILKPININANPKSDFNYVINGLSIDFTAIQTIYPKYRWVFGDGDSLLGSGKVSHVYKISPLGIKVCLKTYNTAECYSETCRIITKNGGINSGEKFNGFKLIPNPNRGQFHIKLEESNNKNVLELLNSEGRIVYKQEFFENEFDLNLPLSVGFYTVRVTTGNQIFIRKMSVLNQ